MESLNELLVEYKDHAPLINFLDFYHNGEIVSVSGWHCAMFKDINNRSPENLIHVLGCDTPLEAFTRVVLILDDLRGKR